MDPVVGCGSAKLRGDPTILCAACRNLSGKATPATHAPRVSSMAPHGQALAPCHRKNPHAGRDALKTTPRGWPRRTRLRKLWRMRVLALFGLLISAGNPTGDVKNDGQSAKGRSTPAQGRAQAGARDGQERAREGMLTQQIEGRGVRDKAVLQAMRKVPRHEFVPPELAAQAYRDRPLPIGHDQTISQPYIVAFMTELASVGNGDRVLEIGTGSGYQAAVLAEQGAEVYTIEIVEALGLQAQKTLHRLGYHQIQTRIGDGYRGWPEAGPFDAIVVTAAPSTVPEPLKQQLKVGGRLVIPVGDDRQELLVITREREGHLEKRVLPVRFVPMTGEVREPRH